MNIIELARDAGDVVNFMEEEHENDPNIDDAAKIAILKSAQALYQAKIEREALVAGIAMTLDKIGKS